MSTTKVYSSLSRPLSPKDMEGFDYEKEMQQATLQHTDPVHPATQLADLTAPTEDENLSDEEKTYKQRFIDGKKFYDESITTQRQENATLKAQLEEVKALVDNLTRDKEETTQQLATQPKRKRYAEERAVKEFDEAATEAAPIIRQIAADMADERVDNRVAEAVKAIKAEAAAEKAAANKRASDSAKLYKAHPDAAQLDDPNTEEGKVFYTWLNKQSDKIKHWMNYTVTQDVDSLIAVLDMFKAQVLAAKPVSGQNNKSLSTNPVRTKADISPVNQKVFNPKKWEKEMDTALRLRNLSKQNELMAEYEEARATGTINPQF